MPEKKCGKCNSHDILIIRRVVQGIIQTGHYCRNCKALKVSDASILSGLTKERYEEVINSEKNIIENGVSYELVLTNIGIESFHDKRYQTVCDEKPDGENLYVGTGAHPELGLTKYWVFEN